MVVAHHYSKLIDILTHWGRVTHICVCELIIIGSDDGLSLGWRKTIIWTNAGMLFIGTIWKKLQRNSHISFKKIGRIIYFNCLIETDWTRHPFTSKHQATELHFIKNLAKLLRLRCDAFILCKFPDKCMLIYAHVLVYVHIDTQVWIVSCIIKFNNI